MATKAATEAATKAEKIKVHPWMVNGDVELTVGELIDKLKKYPKTSLIVMASDEEGNSANTVREVEPIKVVVKNHQLVIEHAEESDTYDPNDPGGNAVYFVACGSDGSEFGEDEVDPEVKA
jgi:hypothetical protein